MTFSMTGSRLDEVSLTTGLDKESLLNLLYGRTLFVDDPNQIHHTAIIGDGAILVGDLRIKANTAVFYNTMIQADKAPISIGTGCCIVDGVNMHNRIEIGDYVHIAHGCIIHRRRTHGCLTIGSGTLVGFGAQVHENIGKGCQIAPGVIVDQPIPDYHFVYDKKLDDGCRQIVISPMGPANHQRVKEMYKSFWGRQIIYKGNLIPLMWYQYEPGGNRPKNSFNQAIQKLESFLTGKDVINTQ